MTDTADSIASVSLLLGKPSVPVWFGLAVEELTRRTDARVDDVTIASPPHRDGGGFRQRIQNGLVRLQDQVILSDLDREVDVRLLPSVDANDVRRCEARPADGVGVTVPDETVSRLSTDVDVVVHHGVGILKGDVLTRPDRGVLGYHHGDIRDKRGPGYGFWEYMEGDERSGVTLQVLDERLDHGRVVDVVPVDVADAHTLAEIRRRLNAASVPLLAHGIRKLADPTFSPERLSAAELGEMYYYSDVTLGTKLRYVLRETAARLRSGPSDDAVLQIPKRGAASADDG